MVEHSDYQARASKIRFKDEKSFRRWFETEEVYSKFGIKKILVSQSEFPDLMIETIKGRRFLAEVELMTSHFYDHGHNPREVDLAIVWVHDQPHRRHRFKVLEANLDYKLIKIDELMNTVKNPVSERIKHLPRLAYPWEKSYTDILRYKNAWRTINTLTKSDVFNADLEDLAKTMLKEVQCKGDTLNELLANREMSKQPKYAWSLVRIAKALILRGTLKLIDDGLIPTQKESPFGLSIKEIKKIEKAINRHKIANSIDSISPFGGYEERKLPFYTDYLDGFTQNFNFKLGSFPGEEICFILHELSIWGFFKKYSRIPNLVPSEEYNPLSREFSPKKVVGICWKRFRKLKSYGFDPPNQIEYLVNEYYKYLILPIGFLINFGRIPKSREIFFYFYVPTREDRLRGWSTEKKRQTYLKEFYQNYKSLFPQLS